jgi:hypothetical protein
MSLFGLYTPGIMCDSQLNMYAFTATFLFVSKQAYPRYPSVKEIHLNASERECLVDLRPYVNTAPYVVQENASVEVCSYCLCMRS